MPRAARGSCHPPDSRRAAARLSSRASLRGRGRPSRRPCPMASGTWSLRRHRALRHAGRSRAGWARSVPLPRSGSRPENLRSTHPTVAPRAAAPTTTRRRDRAGTPSALPAPATAPHGAPASAAGAVPTPSSPRGALAADRVGLRGSWPCSIYADATSPTPRKTGPANASARVGAGPRAPAFLNAFAVDPKTGRQPLFCARVPSCPRPMHRRKPGSMRKPRIAPQTPRLRVSVR